MSSCLGHAEVGVMFQRACGGRLSVSALGKGQGERRFCNSMPTDSLHLSEVT